MKRISYFDVAWDRRGTRGALRLTFDDRSRADLRDVSMGELDLLIAMLRVEKPLFYDDATQRFSTDIRYPD
jgi:hypothetical protein